MVRSDYSLNKVTPRQLEILKLVCKGSSNQEIADTLVVDIKTVEHHLHGVYGSLDVSTQRQLIYKVYKLGLVTPPSSIPHLEELLSHGKQLVENLESTIKTLKEKEKCLEETETLPSID